IFASLDSIIQRLQIDNGTRDTWDNKLTKGAHTGAVFEGLVSAGLAGGIDLFLSNRISKVFNDNLDDLRTLPDPKPIGPGTPPPPRTADPLSGPLSGPPPRGTVPDTAPPPSLNGDLADLFGRHGNDLLAPFTSGGTPGRAPWDNAANATQLRDDLSDLFTHHFADHLGTTGARDLGRDYANTLIRHWNTPDLHGQLKNTLGDRLPPHLRDHLADSPANLQQALHQHNSKATTYLQHLGLGMGSGALEGYLGEGLGNAAQGEGWKASVWSATAGASQAGTQQVTTDSALAGINALTTPPTLPDPLTPPPPPTDTEGKNPTADNIGRESSGGGRPGPSGNGPSGDDGSTHGNGPDRSQDGQNTPSPGKDQDAPGPNSSQQDTRQPEPVAKDNTDTTQQETPDNYDWPLADMPDLRTDQRMPAPETFDGSKPLSDHPDPSPFDPLGLLGEKPGFPDFLNLSPKNDFPFSPLPWPGHQNNLTVFMLNELSYTGPDPTPGETDPPPTHNTTQQTTQTTPAPLGSPETGTGHQGSKPEVGTTPPKDSSSHNRPARDSEGRPGHRSSTENSDDGFAEYLALADAYEAALAHTDESADSAGHSQPGITGPEPVPVPEQNTAQDTSASDAPRAPRQEAEQPPVPTSTGQQENTPEAGTTPLESGSNRPVHDSDNSPEHRLSTPDDGLADSTDTSGHDQPGAPEPDPAPVPEQSTTADAQLPADHSESGSWETYFTDSNADSEQEDRPGEDEFRLGPHYIDHRFDPRFSHIPPRLYRRHLTDDLDTPSLSDGSFTHDDLDTTPHHNPTDNETPPELPPHHSAPPPERNQDPDEQEPNPESDLSDTDSWETYSTSSNPDTGSDPGGPPYRGSVEADRSGTPYDLAYLLTSSLVNSTMIHVEHMASFVDDALDTSGLDPAAAGAVRQDVAAQARRDMTAFFRPGGFRTAALRADGSTWQVRVELRPTDGLFHHAPSEAAQEGSAAPELKLVDEAGEGNPAESSGVHGGNKYVGIGFQVSPLLIGPPRAGALGPRFLFTLTGGTRQRATGQSTSILYDGYSSYEIKGKPEIYVSDVTMSFTMAPEGGPGGGPEDGLPPVNVEAPSANGLILVLPGTVTGKGVEGGFDVTDPFARREQRNGDRAGSTPERGNQEGNGRGGRPGEDPRQPSPHAGNGHPVWVGPLLSGDRSSPSPGKPLADWVRDHLWPPDRHRAWWRSALDAVDPGAEERRQRRLDLFHQQVEEKFGDKALRNNLPKMTNDSAVFAVTDPSGTSRLVALTSVPTSYSPKDHSVPPAKYIKGNRTERESGTSTKHSDILGGTFGGGVSVDAGAPGDRYRARVDAIAVEGGLRGRSTDESTRSSSGSVNRMNYGKTPSSAYDVRRTYYVHFDGEPRTYRFHGDSVEILTDEEVRMMKGEAPSDKVPARTDPAGGGGSALAGNRNPAAPAEGTSTAAGGSTGPESGGTAPRPPRPNLAEEHPTTLHGAVPREFTWPDGSQYREVGGQQRTIYQEITHRVLTALADKRPGLVLPDLSRSKADFARRPGRPDGEFFSGSLREHRPFRRDHDIAVFNTHRVMDAISAASLKSGTDDMALKGIAVHLIESRRFSPSALFASGREVIRPPFVTVRVTAGFGALRHAGDTRRGTGGEYTGASERTSGSGSQFRKTVRGTTGAYVRKGNALDAAGNPEDGGLASATLQFSSSTGDGRGVGVKTQSEEIVQYPEGSSVWNSDVRISAKLHENDDVGTVPVDTPEHERGIDLFDEPVRALLTLDTPRAVADGGQQGRGTGPAQVTDIRPIPVDQAQEIIEGRTAPEPDHVHKTRDVSGKIRNFLGRGAPRQPPADGEQAAPGAGGGHRDTGEQNRPDTRTVQQRRTDAARDLGATVEHVNTRFTTGDGNPVSTLLEAAYANFSPVPPWEGRDGVRRTPGRFGFARKLRHFLLGSQGGAQFYAHLLSPENLAGNPALHSSSGLRARTEMSGGLLSPHDIRATMATTFDIDSVDRFEQAEGAIVWKGKNTAEVFTKSGRRRDLALRFPGAGRYNPNPLRSSADGTGAPPDAPDSATAPLLQAGPSAGLSLFDRYSSSKVSSKYSETVEFHPKIEMSYSYSASGRVTQAVEFVKNWSIGPTFPRTARYRGWQARVSGLVTGLIHVRDAHREGLVEDRVVENRDGTLTRSPQPGPEEPQGVRLRPGFEDSGKLIRPADPGRALQTLANRLAEQGWELTGESRENILHALTTHTGLNPNSGAPIPVKVRAIDHSVRHLNSPTTAPLSLDATVTLGLETTGTRIKYLGGNTEYRQKQGREDSAKIQEGDERSAVAGAQGGLLAPLPRPGGDQVPDSAPPSRPYVMGLYGDASATGTRGGSDTVKDTGKRSVGLTMETPYARVSMDTSLRIDLHISEKQGAANTVLSELPGTRRDFTATEESGRVEGLYPAPYLDFGRGGHAPDVRTGTPGATAPENPATAVHHSSADTLRAWTEANDPHGRGDVGGAVLLPVGVENRGQDIRDTVYVVVAKSLGWTPPAGSVTDGRHTPGAVDSARRHVAEKLALNSRNNTLEQSLSPLALKALFLDANAPEGIEMLDLGRTTWALRAVPDPGSARILDFNPNIRLTDSSESGRTFSPARDASTTTAMGMSERPSGRSDTEAVTGVHHGAAGHQSSSVSGGDTARGSKPKEPPHSDRVRTGPAYLVEMDTRWVATASSRERGPWYRRTARYASERAAEAGRWSADRFRAALGGGTAPAPAPPPSTWRTGETRARTTVWISRGDAERLGILTPDRAAAVDRLTADFAVLQKNLKDTEKKYLEARFALDPAADRWAASGDGAARDRYKELEDTYLAALDAFQQAIDAWVEGLGTLREGLAALPPAPERSRPPTVSGGAPPDTVQEEAADAGEPPAGAGLPDLAERFNSELNLVPARNRRTPATG
ncbi:hypothetical protein ACOALZ_19995, partial [Nocardiopsis algeriensis]|uniref:hypothetical protein n=1 Tax=Nocardiopsis algeriensis TaxID=1478215 RepID=UPI003B4290A9